MASAYIATVRECSCWPAMRTSTAWASAVAQLRRSPRGVALEAPVARGVQPGVGLAQQRVEVVAVEWEAGGADRGGHAPHESVAHARRHGGGLADARRRQEHRELVAAEPADGVGGARRPAHLLDHPAQELVAAA